MLIQFILILGFGLALYVTWKRLYQRVIPLAEALAWSVVWVGGIAVTLIPKITERLASVFGVGRGVDLVVYAAVAVLFFLVFKLFVSLERLERKLTDVVRNDALKGMSQQNSNDKKQGNNDQETNDQTSNNDQI